MRPTDSPAVCAKNRGKIPQASPSLRLLTIPAWLHDDSARSLKLVRTNTCRVESPPWRCDAPT